jgi:hypothetical protein
MLHEVEGRHGLQIPANMVNLGRMQFAFSSGFAADCRQLALKLSI